MEYSSEFQRNERQHRLAAAKWVAAIGFLMAAWLATSKWDQEAADALVDQGMKVLAERTDYRETLLSEKHCRAPRKGEVLNMRLADDKAPGKDFECVYWEGVSYGKARRLVALSYSRGWKEQ